MGAALARKGVSDADGVNATIADAHHDVSPSISRQEDIGDQFYVPDLSPRKDQHSTPISNLSTTETARNSGDTFDGSDWASVAGDVITRELISQDESFNLLKRYKRDLVPQFPVVPLLEDSSLLELRQQKPILLLAILAAASGASDVDINLRLNLEIQQVYADRVAMKGERSLELVQAILITVTWYCPPDRFDQLKFYRYLHMAWSMALDIGLDKRPRLPLDGLHSDGTPESNVRHIESIEHRRTLLSCFLMCSMVSVSLRRPSIAPFTTLMEESLGVMETTTNGAPTDHGLCAWVRLQCIMEQFSASCSMSDPCATTDIAEPRVQHTIRNFEKQIRTWKDNCKIDILNGALLNFYHVNMTYLYEFVLYADHEKDHFTPPFTLGLVVPKKHPETLSPATFDAVSAVQSSTQALLDHFLGIQVHELQSLPIVSYVRMTYALVVLTKLSLSAMAMGSALGQLLDARSIRAAEYQDKIVSHLAYGVGSKECRATVTFLTINSKLRSWYAQIMTSVSHCEEKIEPCFWLGKGQDLKPTVRDPTSGTSLNTLGDELFLQRADSSTLQPWDPHSILENMEGTVVRENGNDSRLEGLYGWQADGDFTDLLQFDTDLGFGFGP